MASGDALGPSVGLDPGAWLAGAVVAVGATVGVVDVPHAATSSAAAPSASRRVVPRVRIVSPPKVAAGRRASARASRGGLVTLGGRGGGLKTRRVVRRVGAFPSGASLDGNARPG